MKKYLFAAFFATVGIASAANQNLLQNGDFSIGLYGWSNRSKPAQKITAGADANVPGGGAALCVDIVEDGGKNHGQLVQFRQGVKPGARYRVSALVRSDTADMAYVQAKLMSGKKEGARFSTGTAKQAGEWVELSAEIPTEADTTGIQVLLRWRMNAALVGKSARFARVALVGVSGGAETDEPPKKPEAVSPAVAAPGRDQYVTPAGAGVRDGTSWDNARPGTQDGFSAALAALGPGNTLHIAGGEYPGSISLSLSKGGESLERPIRIVGEDRGAVGFPRPVFRGSWVRSKPSAGPVFLTLGPGAGFVGVENIEVRNYRSTLIAKGPNNCLRIWKVDTFDCRDAFWFEGGMVAGLPESGSAGIVMADCSVVRHTKKAVRTMNGVHHSKFVRCRTDAGGRDFAMAEPIDAFSCGFHLLGSYRAKDGVRRADHHIEFIECEADNNWHEPGPDKSYWNADGFCTESATEDIVFTRCTAKGNTDGGWDVKSVRPVFRECSGIGNKRNFRVWTHKGETAFFEKCLSEGSVDFGSRGHHVGYWLLGGGNAEFFGCTSHGDARPISVESHDPEAVTHINVRDCTFGEADLFRRDGKVVFKEGKAKP